MLFDDIKVGDVVILQTPYRATIEKVTSVAKTIFYAGGMRFRKEDGWQYGGSVYNRIIAKRGTNEEIKKIQDEALRQRYHRLSINILNKCYPSIDDIKEIYSILQKYER